MNKPKIVAFYLPQFHPIKENNAWYGEGFTEWTNVGKAKPLFKGHYQPKVPADLGYYDLRLPDIRIKQAQLAKKAGIDAFCYYHYWFGNGRRIMEMPIEEVVREGKPDFPFCLCWANHSFFKKDWNSKINSLNTTLLLEQTYPGEEDIINHFYSIIHILKDRRYFKINGKLLFVLYSIKNIPHLKHFIETWNTLAKKEGLVGFYFLSYASSIMESEEQIYKETNGIILDLMGRAFGHKSVQKHPLTVARIKYHLGALLNRPLLIKKYSEVCKLLIDNKFKESNIIPCIYPNWDNTPRRGGGGCIMKNSNPDEFKKLVIETLKLQKFSDSKNKMIFIKSWNEWGEGNYMEPDIKFGHGYINALSEALKTKI